MQKQKRTQMKKELKGIDGKVAIHCTTQEEYTQVLDLIPMDAKKRESMNFGFGKYGMKLVLQIISFTMEELIFGNPKATPSSAHPNSSP